MAILEAEGLTKRFKSKEGFIEAVKDVSLTIEAGKVLGFLGPNGAGKTTTIKMIAGLIEPTSGRVSVLGKNPLGDKAALRDVGAILEGNRNIYWRLTALENVEYFGVVKGLTIKEARKRGKGLLEELGLGKKLNIPVRKFSRGMQQKVALAAALIHQPKLLLLDEPTLGLDALTTERVRQLIKEHAAAGRAILLTTHQLGIAEDLSDDLAVIREGELIAYDRTSSLLDAFSTESYRIILGESLHGQKYEIAEGLGACQEEDGSLGFQGDTDSLYQLIAALKPVPILEITKDRANLEGVFLKLMREESATSSTPSINAAASSN